MLLNIDRAGSPERFDQDLGMINVSLYSFIDALRTNNSDIKGIRYDKQETDRPLKLKALSSESFKFSTSKPHHQSSVHQHRLTSFYAEAR